MKCEGKWLNTVPNAPKWYSRSQAQEEVALLNLVSTEVELIPISPSNLPPASIRRQAREANAERISDESHNFILDEILRRERLEYDPMRVVEGKGDEELDYISDSSDKD